MTALGDAPGIIGIIISLSGLALSVHHFSRSYRAAAKVKLIDWLSNMAEDFHTDSGYVETRLLLAQDRAKVRRQFVLEMLYDGSTLQQLDDAGMLTTDDAKALAHLQATNPTEVFNHLEWKLLKNITDYLYFFERLLMQGESLASQGFKTDAQLLVDHFGWFMRSLLCQWTGPQAAPSEASFHDRWRARKLFVVYLAENRYRRLAQVALILIAATKTEESQSVSPDGHAHVDAPKAARIDEFLKDMTQRVVASQKKHGHVAATSLAALRRQWRPVLNSDGVNLH